MSAPGAPSNAHSAMDQMYRYTRHIYDFTRKYYLFGRDKLIEELPVSDGDHICEVGCGTARNLVVLAQKKPGLHLYGIDASAEMLKTAQTSVDGEMRYAKGGRSLIRWMQLCNRLHYALALRQACPMPLIVLFRRPAGPVQ